MWIALIVIAVLVVLLVIWGIILYNRLVRLRVETEQGEANIDVQLRRRADLVPNLVETVKGYATHESGVFTAVTEARSQTFAARTMGEKEAAAGIMGAALTGLFGVVENYPDLKASTNFQQLQTELSTIEETLAAARRYYNATVGAYNAAQQTFPTVIVAKMGTFAPAEFFDEPDEAARVAPQVNFGS